MKSNDKNLVVLPKIQNKKTLQTKLFLQKIKQKKHELEQKLKRELDDEQIKQQSNSIQDDGSILRLNTEIPFYGNLRKPKRMTRFQEQFRSTNHRKTKTQVSVTKEFSEDKSNCLDKQKILPSANLIIQLEEREKQIQKFQEIFHRIPKQARKRTEQNTEQIRKYLNDNNMFFVKLNHIVTSCFIKLSKFISFSKHKTIYKANNNANALYIILGGKVKLIHSEKGFKKICAPGETFSEELLFQDPSKRRSLESARAYTKVFLIEMSMENYKIMCQQMLKFGYKNQFIEMESLIKRNYISKNWLRKNIYPSSQRIKK